MPKHTNKTMLNMLFFILLLSFAVGAPPKTPHCRCRPHEACWPSHDEWSTLNNTIQGNLVAVRPVAAVCHSPEFDQRACEAVQSSWSDSRWRAREPGAVQWENWEAWPEHGNQTCYAQFSREIECGQGRISLYSAKVQDAVQIQDVVRFARMRNLRLVVKNSGHDFLGRSTAPESLQILTQGMKDINVVDNFVPKRASRAEGPAVTIAAGVNLPELYAAVAQHNRTVIAGSSHTVGAAGGFIQGGGHSPFGAWKGLASDNALEFEVVTANGTLVTANSYLNSDLFWALRGGGGGTFGVTVRVTLRTFPEVPVVVSNLNISAIHNDAHFWEAFSQFHAALPALNDAGGSGYYFTSPNTPLNATTSVAAMTVLLMFPNTTDTNAVNQLYGTLLSKLKQIPSIQTQYASFVFPSISSTISTILLQDGGTKSDTTGTVSILTSRLYSKDLLLSKDGPDRLTNAWRSIKIEPYSQILGHVVAGGAVSSNGAQIDSAVHPAWRKAATHLLFSRSWTENTTLAQQHAIIRNTTDVEIPILRSVEGENRMGAYVNEANPYEPGFQESFWGENYARLYNIKQEWDPAGLFITRKGVGSEDWDDAGLCRSH